MSVIMSFIKEFTHAIDNSMRHGHKMSDMKQLKKTTNKMCTMHKMQEIKSHSFRAVVLIIKVIYRAICFLNRISHYASQVKKGYRT